MEVPLAVYLHSCPNCGGPITSTRLAAGLPCEKCLSAPAASLREVVKKLRRGGRLWGLAWVWEYFRRYEEFSYFFRRAVGFDMWGAQRLWARRFVRGKSFTIVAPTGSGKTTFVLTASLYTALGGGRVLLIFPTSALALQAYRRLAAYMERVGASVRVVAYHSMLTERERREALEAVERGDFDVLVVTTAFLPRRFELLSRHKFGLVVADDVDSILRATSRNIDRVLRLLGVSEEVLNTALRAIDLVKQLRRAEIVGDLKEVERLEGELEGLREELRKAVAELKLGVFIASGALAKARRTTRLLLFREILGFDIGGRAEGLRNVVDLYTEAGGDVVRQTVELLRRLGPGGIIYVQDRELGMGIVEAAGGSVEHFFKPRRGVLERFERGEIAALVGMASPRSALVRGIDLPHVVRYVVFVGVPKYRFRLRVEEFSTAAYLTLLYNLRPVLTGEWRYKADRLIGQLKRLAPYPQAVQEALRKAAGGVELSSFERHVAEVARSAVEFVRELLQREEVRKAIEGTEVDLAYIDGELYVLVPDVTTYLQGSGRASRLYAGGLSRGVSILLVDSWKVFHALRREVRLRFDEAEFRPLSEVDLEAVLREVDRDRKAIREILEGGAVAKGVDLMRTVLMVVESPTKARTIANFFGRPAMFIVGGVPVYEVSTGDAVLIITASLGHLYELPTSLERVEQREALRQRFGDFRYGEYDGGSYAVLIHDGAFVPVYNKIWRCRGGTYVDDLDKPPDCRPLDVLASIRDMAVEVDTVLLATDPDSEGEKIAFDLYLGLRPYVSDIRRVEFHEVTRRAILAALANPRSINYSLVKAQIVRRIEDRWLGFGLSKILQRHFGRSNLSAGRVQSPVLGWIVKTYEEARRQKAYRVTLQLDDVELTLTLPVEVAKALRARGKVAVRQVGRERRELNPPPPYTTDELLRDAVRRLGLSAELAMRLAQDLFEGGLITYHRTDSTRVSNVGIAIAREYIAKKFGEGEYRPRAWGEGEGAHEAIRPTRAVDVDELRGLVNAGVLQLAIRPTASHYRLYDLIFRRFMASQMAPSQVEVERYSIEIDGHVSQLERVVDIERWGFQHMYTVAAVEQPLPTGVVEVTVKRSRLVEGVLSQADVLALMRQRKIGRPSTYARILETLAKRYYVFVPRQSRVKLMKPTQLGRDVYHFLEQNFGSLVDEERTRLIEQHMDEIERGGAKYGEVLNELFEEFRREVLGKIYSGP
ncbi:MAG: reverse gyrase [Pyrobaculum sp.]